ncbi:MAG: ATP-binding cassette domain-containing protein [Chloroflexota bacterium]
MSLVELKGLHYRYHAQGPSVLAGVDLRVKAGEFVLVAGASGSGKSTLCRLCNGLIPHFYNGVLEGTVRVAGLDTRDHPVHELFAQAALVFQNSEAQLFNSTVERELVFGLESLALPRQEIQARVGWAAEVCGIAHLLDRAPHTLSGGEQQRVAIAAMLALRPPLLVLDEPFANLDPEATARVRAVLRAIHRAGTTIVLTEHRLHEGIEEATRLVVLDQGRLALDGEPRRVLREDLTRYHLNVPAVVRFARTWHLPEVPLTVDEALALLEQESTTRILTDYSDSPTRNPCIRVENPRGVPLQLRSVWFAFENAGRPWALRDVSLAVQAGEQVALVGHNGSGKTTLLKHFNGLLKPGRGSVLVLGQDTRTAKVADLARQVGFVFQNPGDQIFKLTVREEIEVSARALGRFDATWLESLYESFALHPLLERSPYRLSEGEKKRVAFAAALAARPTILVLDEPTTGQDAAFREALIKLLDELGARGMTVVLATHDLEFAEQVAPRWIALANGAVVADGPPDAVMADTEAMARAALRPTADFRLRHSSRLAARLPDHA